jgi:thioredoxin reductase (NADPH)
MKEGSMTLLAELPNKTGQADMHTQTTLVSAEYAQLLLPKLSNDHLEVLHTFGDIETTTAGEVLSAAGDLSYDLMVVLEGEVEAFDCYEGSRRTIVTLRPRDFIAELNLLTDQRVYVTSVVTKSGAILRVPKQRVRSVIDSHADLGELLVQTMFRRREAFLQIRAGVQIIGSRYSADTQRLREFAARNRLAYAWVDLDTDEAGLRTLCELGLTPGESPVVVLGGSAALSNPSNATLAQAVGISAEPVSGRVYDLLVVGAGPAGLGAAVYGSSEGLRTAAIDEVAPGGQASTTSRIENYLGFPAGVSGEEFGERALLQARRLGAEMFVPQRAVELTRPDGHYELTLDSGVRLLGKAVIVATGVNYRRLDVPGIERFEGLGVFYSPLAGTEDLEADEPVVIVGGGNSAGQAAVALAGQGHDVHVLVRGQGLAQTMSAYLVDRIAQDPRISVAARTVVAEVQGATQLEGVVTKDLDSGDRALIPARRLFAMIGAEPHTSWLSGAVERDDHGFILTGTDVPKAALATEDWLGLGRIPFLFETSLPGVFAVGDVRANSVKRVSSAVGEGSMAVRLVQEHLGLLTT